MSNLRGEGYKSPDSEHSKFKKRRIAGGVAVGLMVLGGVKTAELIGSGIDYIKNASVPSTLECQTAGVEYGDANVQVVREALAKMEPKNRTSNGDNILYAASNIDGLDGPIIDGMVIKVCTTKDMLSPVYGNGITAELVAK